jgi:tetratricopeptide (TPR) repeat protein
MPYTLSRSTRVLLIGLLLLGFVFQCAVASSYLISNFYSHNGEIARGDGNSKLASWHFGQANAWDPHDYQAWYWLADSEDNLNDADKTTVALEQSLRHSPYYVPSLDRAAGIMIETKQIDTASQLVSRAERITPNFWEPKYLRGLITLHSGDADGAVDELLLADQHSLEPQHLLLGFLAQAALESGRLELAANAIDRSIAAETDVARYWVMRGDIYFQLRDMQESLTSFEKAFSLLKDEPIKSNDMQYELSTLEVRMAQVYYWTDDFDGSFEFFYRATERYVELKAHSIIVSRLHQVMSAGIASASLDHQLKWGSILSAAGHFDEAELIFGRLKSEDDTWTAVARYSYAMVFRDAGQYDDALEQLERLPDLFLVPAMAYADALNMSGKPAAARFAYTRMSSMLTLTEAEQKVIAQHIAALPTSQ